MAEVATGIIGALAGVVVGFVLAVIWETRQRKGRVAAHWSALRAEATLCEKSAKRYLADGIKAPLYRLPVSAFHTSFPALLADADLAEADVEALEEFYTWVEDINRGLDAAASTTRTDRLNSEAKRLAAKTEELLGTEDAERGLFGPSLERHRHTP